MKDQTTAAPPELHRPQYELRHHKAEACRRKNPRKVQNDLSFYFNGQKAIKACNGLNLLDCWDN